MPGQPFLVVVVEDTFSWQTYPHQHVTHTLLPLFIQGSLTKMEALSHRKQLGVNVIFFIFFIFFFIMRMRLYFSRARGCCISLNCLIHFGLDGLKSKKLKCFLRFEALK